MCLLGQMVRSNARTSCINESKRDFVCNVVQKRLRLAGQVPFLLFFLEESQLCRAGPGENKVAELEKNLVKRTVGIFDFMKIDQG